MHRFVLTIAVLLVSTPALAGPLVVTQFQTRGAGGAADEVVEVFNATSASVNIFNYAIVFSNSTGSSTVVHRFPNISLAANAFYLVAKSGSSAAGIADATFNQNTGTDLPDNGGVVIYNANGDVLDAVCSASNSASFCENPGLTIPTTDSANNVFLRKGTGCTRQDTDVNADDFTGPAAPNYKTNADSCGGGGGCTEGDPCDDANVCTLSTTCQANGSCGGGTARVCNTPPAPTCSGTTRTTYAATGTCANPGGCSYTPSTTNCPFGCAGTSCASGACTGGSCDNPPNTTCYAATGTCESGVCAYDVNVGASCDDGFSCTENDTCGSDGQCLGTLRACNQPPASLCEGPNLRIFTNGSCIDGLCNYAATLNYCRDGCDQANRRCIGGVFGDDDRDDGLGRARNDEDDGCAAAPAELASVALLAALFWRRRR